MYRTWLGIGILLFLLIFGLTVSSALQKMQAPVSEQLEAAAQQAITGDTAIAYAAAQNARKQWNSRWRPTAAFSDHAPMDEIDGLFGQMESYVQSDMPREFAACCRRISILVEAVWEAHTLNWWNLL